jgi:DNA-binding response OmpR family regulator
VLQEAAPDALMEMTPTLEEAQQVVLGVKPELFVLDVDGIPDLGQDFLYDLRTSHPNARAIVLTGMHLPEQREQAAGLGAIHFLEKPVAHWDFVELVQRLMQPTTEPTTDKFQGTLRDLQFTDIIQLKCMSGATSVVEFTGPNGEKARVFFETGQVRHATGPGRQGMEAFNEIVRWKGGTVSEVVDAPASPTTIDMDWQHLLIEAVRGADEISAAGPARKSRKKKGSPKILAVDDSLMLLSFVKEVLLEANYDVFSASSGEEAVREAQSSLPDLILLDFILPDMRGDEVCRRLLENPGTAGIPVVYMSGYGAELQASRSENSNVIGFLNKPFTSDLLVKTVETHMPRKSDESESTKRKAAPQSEPTPESAADFPIEQEPAYQEVSEVSQEVSEVGPEVSEVSQEVSEVGPEVPQTEEAPWWTPAPSANVPAAAPAAFEQAAEQHYVPEDSNTGGVYFCGDTRFFSINRAFQIIANQKLTGTLRFFWERQPVDLLTQNGLVLFATTNDPELYCSEAPVVVSNVDPDQVAAAKARQQETGCPMFITLAQENLISHEPAMQQVQHYGQKLFAELWAAPCVRFSFHQGALPDYANGLAAEMEVDQWASATLRFVQFPQLGDRAYYDPASIPAYTRDGFERVQNLRLTVAEAQFASQFNGARSVQQIAKNLRLDLKFASVTLFRFLALEIIECWPAASGAGQEKKGVFQRLGNAIGLGE